MAIIGAILGDIAGSKWEFDRPKNLDYEHVELFTDDCSFTDDTVLTVATKYAILNNISFADAYHKFGNEYINAGYGEKFFEWLIFEDKQPYNSLGNGSAMRVSPIVDLSNTHAQVMSRADFSAKCTHNHPEGIKGAVVTAVCGWMAKTGASKKEIEEYANSQYPADEYLYPLSMSLKDLREKYEWDVTCQGSVPVAIRCFLDSENYESFLRNVLSLRCDSDTLCAIGGGIAEEYYKGTGFDNDVLLRKYLDNRLYKIVKQVSTEKQSGDIIFTAEQTKELIMKSKKYKEKEIITWI